MGKISPEIARKSAADGPAMIRLIGGELNGRAIQVPPRDVRPLPARARESLFNRLRGELKGSRVLDLFAGSGLFGMEALSHGAAEAILVEKNRRVAQVIQRNLAHLDLGSRVRLEIRDVLRINPTLLAPVDIVFADPPFDQNLEEPLLERIVSWQHVLENHLFILKHERTFSPPELAGFQPPDSRHFAGVTLTLWRSA